MPEFVNKKGDSIAFGKQGLFSGIIILNNEKVVEYPKIVNCNRVQGIFHCFTKRDFDRCCEKLVLLTRNNKYYCPLEHCQWKKQDNYKEFIPEYDKTKELYQGKSVYPSIEALLKISKQMRYGVRSKVRLEMSMPLKPFIYQCSSLWNSV